MHYYCSRSSELSHSTSHFKLGNILVLLKYFGIFYKVLYSSNFYFYFKGLKFSITFYLLVIIPIFLILIPFVAWSANIVEDPFLSTNGYMSEFNNAYVPVIVVMIAVYGSNVFIIAVPPLVETICVPILTFKIVAATRGRNELARYRTFLRCIYY